MSWLFESGGQIIGASASASVRQMNIQELISFRIDWFGLFAVEILKSFLQHHVQSINSAALTFFMAQLAHRYMTTGTTIALTRRTFVSKVMSLLCWIIEKARRRLSAKELMLLNSGVGEDS